MDITYDFDFLEYPTEYSFSSFTFLFSSSIRSKESFWWQVSFMAPSLAEARVAGKGANPLDNAVKQYILLSSMKTTLDVPDDLYRAVKAKSAMDGLSVRSVTLMLYGDWLARPDRAPGASAPAPATKKLPAWFGLGRGDVRRNADGPHDMESIRAAVARGIAAERCGEGAR